MPHSVSAKKRVRQNEKRRLRNKAKKTRLKTETKKHLQALEEKKFDAAAKQLDLLYKLYDKAAKTKVLHPNKAARLKSQCARKLNAARAAGAGAAK
ncbi:MAG: 30S ribosomal protein S20 [Planctomycetes bacterium]|nr:30S ribosomal protein S20 [Planctomycetota bacterium]